MQNRSKNNYIDPSFLDPGVHIAPVFNPSQLITTPKPHVTQITIHPAGLPVTPAGVKPPGKTSTMTTSSNATATKPAVAASVLFSKKTTNVTLSIGHVKAPNVTNKESPRVIGHKPPSVLPVTPSRNSTNVTVRAADQLKGVLDKLVSLLDAPTGRVSETGKYRLTVMPRRACNPADKNFSYRTYSWHFMGTHPAHYRLAIIFL